MKIKWAFGLALMIGAGTAQLRAAEGPAAPASSQPSSAPSLIQATDADAIKAATNSDVVVEGVIESAEWSSTGKVMNAKFKDSDLRTAAFSRIKNKLDQAFSGDVAKTLTGAKVRIRGNVTEFKGHPEITVNQTSQITILEPGKSDSATSKPAK
jgi:DNA/RNA endonuclease YhcR with UshA esterase domain